MAFRIQSVTVCLAAFLLVDAVGGAADLAPLGPGAEVWEKHVKDRPCPRVLADYHVLTTPLIPARAEISGRASALMSSASALGRCDLHDPQLTEAFFLEYADRLKGNGLTEKERSRVAEAFKRYRQSCDAYAGLPYYATFFSGQALVLSKTTQSAKTMEDALEQMTRKLGLVCTTERSARCDFERYQESLDKGIPVILERNGAYSLAFAYAQSERRASIAEGILAEVPFEPARWPLTREDREAARKSKWVRLGYEDRMEMTFPTEVTTRSSIHLVKGFAMEPFERGKYTAYFIYDWRVSAEGWHDEIAKAIGMKVAPREKPAVRETVAPPPATYAPGTPARTLWDEQIKGRPNPRIFDNFEIIEGVPLFAPQAGVDLRTLAVMTAAYRAEAPGIAEFQLTPSVVYDLAEDRPNVFIIVDEKQMGLLKPISDEARKQYDSAMPPGAGDVNAAPALVRLHALLKDCATLEDCARKLARVSGWVCTYERSGDSAFAKYKKAIDMRIPILLERDNALRIAFGYLRLAGRDCIVLVDPAKIPSPQPAADGKPGEPLKTTAAMEFIDAFDIEPFEQGRYAAHFLHSWRVGADVYRPQIQQIMDKTLQAAKDKKTP